MVERLTNAPVQQRKKLLTDYLRDAVAEVTRVDAAEIREDAGFFDLGMDSLMAIELRRRIEQGVGREIPVTLVMDHPRLSDAANYLLGEVLGLSEQASAPKPAPVVTTRTDEPIAIVAVSCRFPGAPDPEAFWEVLSGGVDAIREVPEDRFDIDEFYDPDPETPGKTYTRFGGFLDGVDGFDPEFFGISPREAVWIEPQQRLMLETVVGGFGTRRVLASGAARQPNRRLRGGGRQRVCASAVFGVGRQDRAVLHHRQCAQRHFRSGCLRARTRRTGSSGRYRMQLGVGGRSSGLPGIALR